MEYLLGLLTGVVFLLVLFSGVLIGMRVNKTAKHKPPDVNEEEQRKAKQLNDEFIKLMSYNENIARQPKKVN